MHVHASQPNPYAQLDALRSAQRVAARQEAERVRSELVESASELVAESDFSDLAIIQRDDRRESQKHPKRGNTRKANVQHNPTEEETTDGETTGAHLSDWA
jgi:hypothetical protein